LQNPLFFIVFVKKIILQLYCKELHRWKKNISHVNHILPMVKSMEFVYDVLIPIVIIIFGCSLLVLTIFFFKKGTIFFGVVIPVPVKIKKEKNQTAFWFLLISCFICSIIVIIAGFSMFFGFWG